MSYEKLVKGATKIKLAAPKPKYIEPILQTTYNEYDNDFRSVMNALGSRLRDSAWTIVYKSLIVIHYMIRDGARDVALEYLANNPRMFENLKAQGHLQAVSMLKYARYLHTRALQFKKTGIDYVRYENQRTGAGRLKDLSVDKGLLRECDSVYTQIESLLRCKFHEEDVVNNSVVLTAFRLLVSDLLALYQVFNEGVINLLEHYFEMSKVDATHALDIYEGFTKQTANVVAFLKIAKHLEHATKLRVPNIKHAPTGLTKSLEDYLNDPDFDINHRQYLAEKQAHKNVEPKLVSSSQQHQMEQEQPQPQSQPDLVDLFTGGVQQQESVLDSNSRQAQPINGTQATGYNPFFQQQIQQTSIQPQTQQMQFPQQQNMNDNGQYQQPQPQPQLQQTVTAQQQPFQQTQFAQPQVFVQQQQQPLQQAFTGAGFGGYTADPDQAQHLQQFQQPQQQQPVQLQRSDTGGNPFRQSMLMSNNTGGNPFKHQTSLPTLSENSVSNFASQTPTPQPQPQQPQPEPQLSSQSRQSVQLHRTGTNPFARLGQQQQELTPQSTGGNPFRKSMFAATPSGVQSTGYNPTFGGLERLPSISVFPQTTGQNNIQGQQTGSYVQQSQQTGLELGQQFPHQQQLPFQQPQPHQQQQQPQQPQQQQQHFLI